MALKAPPVEGYDAAAPLALSTKVKQLSAPLRVVSGMRTPCGWDCLVTRALTDGMGVPQVPLSVFPEYAGEVAERSREKDAEAEGSADSVCTPSEEGDHAEGMATTSTRGGTARPETRRREDAQTDAL